MRKNYRLVMFAYAVFCMVSFAGVCGSHAVEGFHVEHHAELPETEFEEAEFESTIEYLIKKEVA